MFVLMCAGLVLVAAGSNLRVRSVRTGVGIPPARGLPNLPGKLSEARSYAERLFDYRQIGPLDEASSMRALEEPAVKFGARFHPQALQTLLHAAGGYPYFIQEFGKAIWDIRDRRTKDPMHQHHPRGPAGACSPAALSRIPRGTVNLPV
jgi:hypothetical protein